MQKKYTTVFSWSIIVKIGGLLFGFDTAVISGVEKTIQELFQLTPFWQGFTISSALIGTVIGALVSGMPADKYGRKPILFITASLLFPVVVGGSAIGGGYAFTFFAVIMILQAIVVWKYFPETKGRTLEDISEELVGKNP